MLRCPPPVRYKFLFCLLFFLFLAIFTEHNFICCNKLKLSNWAKAKEVVLALDQESIDPVAPKRFRAGPLAFKLDGFYDGCLKVDLRDQPLVGPFGSEILC